MNVLIHCCIELPVSTNLENIANSFSEPKKKLLYYLKVMQQAGLEELAKAMKISRMGVHKRLALLQKRGLVEGVQTRASFINMCGQMTNLSWHICWFSKELDSSRRRTLRSDKRSLIPAKYPG